MQHHARRKTIHPALIAAAIILVLAIVAGTVFAALAPPLPQGTWTHTESANGKEITWSLTINQDGSVTSEKNGQADQAQLKRAATEGTYTLVFSDGTQGTLSKEDSGFALALSDQAVMHFGT